MTVNAGLHKRLAKAEDRLKPKDLGSLQQRIDAYAVQFEAGEDDGLLSEYPASLFEPSPEILHKRPVDGVSEGEATNNTTSEDRTAVYGHPGESTDLHTPLEEFKYCEIKPGWTERVERLPDGSEIRHVHLDLTQIDLDEIDELDRPAWDWSPSIRGPSLRDVKRSMGL